MIKTKTASRKTSKSAFIRSLPPTMPARDVVAKAKIAGMSVTEAYVYAIRSAAKRTNRAARRPAAHVSQPVSSSGAEALLQAVAAEIGLGRAIELLKAERARVHTAFQA
jgi:hypothetical protein